MLITKEITIDLLHRGVTEPLEAVQCDANTRAVKVTLLNGGESWTPPSGAAASVAYKKPDGTAGWYDKLPDGTAACSLAGNTVTAIFAPQMLTAAGKVQAAVIFQDSRLNQLATFVFAVEVQANPAAGKNISNDYYKYSTMEQLSAAVDAWLTETEAEKNDFLSKADGALEAMRDVITTSDNAPAIVCEATGEVIAVSDASDRLLHGLTLYGKTTQNGTPTPTSPVELVSAGASGAINTTVCGKNLLSRKVEQGNGMASTGISVDINDDGSIHISGTAKTNANIGLHLTKPIYQGETVYIKCTGYDTCRFVGYGADGSIIYGTNTSGGIYTLNNAANSDYFKATALTVRIPMGTTVDKTVKLMVSIDPGDYEAPKIAQTLTIQTPNSLPGIPVSSGGNYTDENGQQWICDEVDFARGVYVQRIVNVMNYVDKVWHYENYGSFCINNDVSGVMNYSVLLGTHYTVFPNESALADMPDMCVKNTTYLTIKDSRFTNIADFKTWAKENNVRINSALATPVETALSAEEMAAYYALYSNKPNTTAFNDAGAGMKIAYVADTKLYFDNKFGELAAALVHNT